jgi:hypothetical protein
MPFLKSAIENLMISMFFEKDMRDKWGVWAFYVII